MIKNLENKVMCNMCLSIYDKETDTESCSKCGESGYLTDLSSFVLVGNNRKEAYNDFIEFEKGFDDEDNPYLKMSFEDFCKELDKGYGQSDCLQITRLYEAPDGKIYYDNEYC